MNNPEVKMPETTPPTGFDALDKATTAAGIAISLVMNVPTPLRPIADQVVRSASSVPANLAEGAGRAGRDRLHHFRIAFGSAKEVDRHLRLLLGAEAVEPRRTGQSLRLFDDVRAMTWRLIHPKS
jgi:four helix bundle protein